MKMFSHLNALDLTRQLVAAGILAGDAQDSATTHPAPHSLFVCQEGGLLENSAFDLDCGYGTGFILSLHIAVDLSAFAIWKWHLDPPWGNPQIEWLPDPLGSVFDAMYQIPAWGVKFARREVINHRRGLRRGCAVDGLLLGYSFESIPDSYPHGANVDANLVLIDIMERRFSTPVQLWVNRMAKIDRKQTEKTTRGQLFEKQDRTESEFAQEQA